ncbi:hypothetical protein [uncultured Bradyrhizobium sp.]|uniref:hypothetical protein n=1 Tax=uncultured Bradyrhizobium sp. TaxID=199684 RepID=UPI0035CA6305
MRYFASAALPFQEITALFFKMLLDAWQVGTEAVMREGQFWINDEQEAMIEPHRSTNQARPELTIRGSAASSTRCTTCRRL